jgi:NAD(P)-dependent dehydrogenase (short-subunit alcohol dehydrogenase family)
MQGCGPASLLFGRVDRALTAPELLALVRLARLLTPVMQRQGSGAFVAISSAWAFEPSKDYPLTTLRAALGAWVKLYADAHAATRIRMNAVLPGFVDSLPEKPGPPAAIPASRCGSAREIADTVVVATVPVPSP